MGSKTNLVFLVTISIGLLIESFNAGTVGATNSSENTIGTLSSNNSTSVTNKNHETSNDVKKDKNPTLQAVIYTWSHFRGIPYTMDIKKCTRVPRILYKKASSIDTLNNCVMVFSRENCLGRKVIIAPGTSGHSSLADVNFDGELVSMKVCDGAAKAKVEAMIKAGKSKNSTENGKNRPKRTPISPISTNTNENNPIIPDVKNCTGNSTKVKRSPISPIGPQPKEGTPSTYQGPDQDSDNSQPDAPNLASTNITLSHVIY